MSQPSSQPARADAPLGAGEKGSTVRDRLWKVCSEHPLDYFIPFLYFLFPASQQQDGLGAVIEVYLPVVVCGTRLGSNPSVVCCASPPQSDVWDCKCDRIETKCLYAPRRWWCINSHFRIRSNRTIGGRAGPLEYNNFLLPPSFLPSFLPSVLPFASFPDRRTPSLTNPLSFAQIESARFLHTGN